MDDPRQRHGNHTWDIVIEYFRCPSCGCIIENREKYENRLGKHQKEVSCRRCNQSFTATKQTRPTFGPLLGDELEAS
jgi:uncharacterized paraquat-inducible protein A